MGNFWWGRGVSLGVTISSTYIPLPKRSLPPQASELGNVVELYAQEEEKKPGCWGG